VQVPIPRLRLSLTDDARAVWAQGMVPVEFPPENQHRFPVLGLPVQVT